MKQQRIKNLTWKYFWQQKFKEVGLTILILSILIFVPYFLGSWIGDGQSKFCGDGNWEDTLEKGCGGASIWIEGLFYLAVIILILLILREWISKNWKEAKKRAKKDIRQTGDKPKQKNNTRKGAKR